MLRINSKFPPYCYDSMDLGWVTKNYANLFYCREGFHNQYRGRQMLFRGNIRKARLLIGRVEQQVGVKRGQARFYPSDRQGWMGVTPGWWRADPMRFSLFTLLLRSSRDYTTIEGALRGKHLRPTAQAVRSFLSGKTSYLGTVSGTYGWGRQMGSGAVGPLCLISAEGRPKLEKAKKSREMLAAARNIAKIVQSGSNEDAILYQLSQIKW